MDMYSNGWVGNALDFEKFVWGYELVATVFKLCQKFGHAVKGNRKLGKPTLCKLLELLVGGGVVAVKKVLAYKLGVERGPPVVDK